MEVVVKVRLEGLGILLSWCRRECRSRFVGDQGRRSAWMWKSGGAWNRKRRRGGLMLPISVRLVLVCVKFLRRFNNYNGRIREIASEEVQTSTGEKRQCINISARRIHDEFSLSEPLKGLLHSRSLRSPLDARHTSGPSLNSNTWRQSPNAWALELISRVGTSLTSSFSPSSQDFKDSRARDNAVRKSPEKREK